MPRLSKTRWQRYATRPHWDLPYQHGKPEVTLPLLKDMGLEVIKAKRTVNILVVEPE
jgi:hypothetical protein